MPYPPIYPNQSSLVDACPWFEVQWRTIPFWVPPMHSNSHDGLFFRADPEEPGQSTTVREAVCRRKLRTELDLISGHLHV
jgi:hypothetical protein